MKVLDCGCHKIDRKGNLYTCVEQYSSKGMRGIQTRKSNNWRKLVVMKSKPGYLKTILHGINVRINRIVAEAYLENEHTYPEVHHINGIRTDNRVENLRWGNQKQNAQDRYIHKTQPLGSKWPHSKLKEKDIPTIRKLVKENSLQRVADKFKVSKKLILLIKQNKIWRHVL